MFFITAWFSQCSEEEGEDEEEEGESKADDPYAHLSKKEKKKLKKQVRPWSKLGTFDFFNIKKKKNSGEGVGASGWLSLGM